MDLQKKKKLFNLKTNQAKVLLPLLKVEESAARSLATGLTHQTGPVMSSLAYKGFVRQVGIQKNDNFVPEAIWKVTDEWKREYKANQKEIEDILSTIATPTQVNF